MNKLVSCSVIIGLVLITILSPFMTHSASARFTLIKAKSETIVIPEKDHFENVALNEEVKTSLVIIYSYSRFSIPSNYFLLSPSPTKINLEVSSKPDWCSVKLEKENLSAEIPMSSIIVGGNVTLEVGVSLKIISKNAPGYTEGEIVIKATSSQNGNIQPSEGSCTIKIKPGFYPDVRVNRSFIFVEISPGESKSIALKVENLGNMDIVASIDVKNISAMPEFLSINTSEINPFSVKSNGTKTIYLEVSAKKLNRKINEVFSIPLEISYHAKGHEELKGPAVSLNMDVKVKGGEPPSSFNPAIIAGIVSIVIVAILVILLLIRKRMS